MAGFRANVVLWPCLSSLKARLNDPLWPLKRQRNKFDDVMAQEKEMQNG